MLARCWLYRWNFTGVESALLFMRMLIGRVKPPGRPHTGVWRMTNARKYSRISTVPLAVLSLLSLLAAAQEQNEFSCTVGPGAVISITNNYGPINVKPS